VAKRIVQSPQAMKALVGQELGVSDWLVMTQERINTFAEASGDYQWIHVDVERCKTDMPDGKTIAHGNLTLAVIATFGRDARPAEVRLYSTLFNKPDPGAGGDLDADLNSGSLEVLSGALLEPSLAEMPVGEAVQFERQGYFCQDPASGPDALVFNRTIELRDTWAKMQVGG